MGCVCRDHENIASGNELRSGSDSSRGRECGSTTVCFTSLHPVRMPGSGNEQVALVTAFEGISIILETEIGHPVVVQIERDLLPNPDDHMCRRVDDLGL